MDPPANTNLCHGLPRVLAFDTVAARREAIDSASHETSCRVLWHSAVDACAAPLRHFALACVAVDGEPACASFAVELVVRLAAAGVRVAAYADGCSDWRIGQQCHLTVLGAAALLDSALPSFPHALATTLEAWRLEQVRREASERDDAQCMAAMGLVGRSAALRAAFAQAHRAALLSDLPVLLSGETGCGKELLAQAIHHLDPQRCNAPMVAVNCAAIAPALAEAELFGHQRGAYTGAHRDKRGLVRTADGGVLFLDEVGVLGEELQGKLLRAIQEQRVLPVGAEREEPIDVRFVAATHRDLSALVREGRFREDLYYRLTVLPITVPPLRERREDIGPLIDHFLARHADRHGLRTPTATAAFREALAQCDLPGNVRQLDNLVRQALLAAGEATLLDLAHLPLALLQSLDSAARANDAPPATGAVAADTLHVPPPGAPAERSLAQLFAAENWNLARCVDACERSLLETALARSRGNQTATARLLGVTPRSVYTKLRKHLLA